MTNIIENKKQSDVQTHINSAYQIIDEYLPRNYVDRVLEKLKENPPSKGVIRNVKAKLNIRLEILNAMVEVALEDKAQIESLKLKTITT